MLLGERETDECFFRNTRIRELRRPQTIANIKFGKQKTCD